MRQSANGVRLRIASEYHSHTFYLKNVKMWVNDSFCRRRYWVVTKGFRERCVTRDDQIDECERDYSLVRKH